MESFEFRAAFHVCSWLRECHSFDRKTTELIQLFQYTTTRSLMIFSVYVRMNNIITRKIERLRALITLAVCTRPNFRRFVPLRFCVAKIWPGTRLRSTTPTTSAPAAHEYTTPTTPAPAARERQEYTMPTASAPAAHERQEYTMLIVPTLTIHRSNHEQSVYPKPPSAQQEERQEHLQFEFNYMTMNCVEAGYNPRKAQIV